MADETGRNRERVCPFPGLRSFTADEAHLFFGREGQSDAIVSLLARTGFAGIVGTSGSGKSSLFRAGVLPSLEGGYAVTLGSRWLIADCRPGSDPIGDVERKLAPLLRLQSEPGWLRRGSSSIVDAVGTARAGGAIGATDNVLILVDQFEELFRYQIRDSAGADRDEKAEFVAMLLRSIQQRADRIFVVLTMRSDFLGDCAEFRDLPETINTSQYLVPRLTRQQRRAAIEGPVRVAAAAIAGRLVQRLLNELGEDQDQLPVLQHALMRTWDKWVERGKPLGTIDTDDYELVGSVRDALGEHAEEVLADVQKALGEQRGELVVKRIFQRLRTRDANGREVRSPATVGDLVGITGASLDDLRAALDPFRDDDLGRTFIVPFRCDKPILDADTSIDITHEALIRCWPKLRDVWAREEDDDRRMYTRLAMRAEDEGSRPQMFLEGGVLQRVSDWWKERKPNEAWAARYHRGFDAADAYLRASLDKLEEEEKRKDLDRKAKEAQHEKPRQEDEARKLEDARRDAEVRASTFKKRAAYGAAAVSVLVIGVLGYLLKNTSDANVRATTSEASLRVAQSDLVTQLLASRSALAAHDGGASLLPSLLLAATSLQRTPSVEAQSLVSSALALIPPHAAWPSMSALDLAFGNGGLLTTIGEDHVVHVWDLQSQKEVGRLPDEAVQKMAFARGAARIATASAEGPIRIWNVESAEKLHELACAKPGAVRITDDGTVVAALCDGQPVIWRTADDWSRSTPVKVATGYPNAQWRYISLAGDGKVVALAVDPTQRASADISEPDVGRSPVISVQTVGTDKILATMRNAESSVTAIALFGDSSLASAFAVGDESGTIRVWAVDPNASGTLDLTGNTTPVAWTTKVPGAVAALGQDMTGETLMIGSRDGLVSAWVDGEEIARMIGDTAVTSLSLTNRNGIAAVLDSSRHVHAWDLRAMENLTPIRRGLLSAQFSADGSLMLFRTRTGTFSGVFDVAQGRVLHQSQIRGGFYALAIAPENDLVAVREQSETEEREYSLNVRPYSSEKIGPPRWSKPATPGGTVTAAQFSSDGRHVAAFSPTGPVASGRSPDDRIGLFVWNTASGEEDLYLPATEAGLNPRSAPPYVFVGSEPRLLVATPDGLSEISLETRKPVATSLKARGRVTRLARSRDGRMLAVAETGSVSGSTGSGEGPAVPRLRLLEYPSGAELRTVDLVSVVRAITFDVTGRFVTITDSDSVWVWNLQKTERPARYPMRLRTFTAMMGPQGQLVAANERGVAYVSWWSKDLVGEACRRAGRDLTQQEWERYMGKEPRVTVCAGLR